MMKFKTPDQLKAACESNPSLMAKALARESKRCGKTATTIDWAALLTDLEQLFTDLLPFIDPTPVPAPAA